MRRPRPRPIRSRTPIPTRGAPRVRTRRRRLAKAEVKARTSSQWKVVKRRMSLRKSMSLNPILRISLTWPRNSTAPTNCTTSPTRARSATWSSSQRKAKRWTSESLSPRSRCSCTTARTPWSWSWPKKIRQRRSGATTTSNWRWSPKPRKHEAAWIRKAAHEAMMEIKIYIRFKLRNTYISVTI